MVNTALATQVVPVSCARRSTAFSAVGSCLNNLGPGLGEVATHYGNISDTAKWLLALTMLLGRLEIFTLLVLITPTFWRS